MRKLILAVFIFAGCSKKEDKPTTAIQVQENVTNAPVIGADVVLFTSAWGGALGRTLFQGVTDVNGICDVPSEHYNNSASEMNVVKEKYWPFLVQKSTTVYITPEGWLKLRIHQVGNYPAGSKLLLNLYDQYGLRSDLTDYSTAVDSLILVKGFGSQQNKIDWQVVDATFNLITYGTLNGLQIPRLDTLKNVTLDY